MTTVIKNIIPIMLGVFFMNTFFVHAQQDITTSYSNIPQAAANAVIEDQEADAIAPLEIEIDPKAKIWSPFSSYKTVEAHLKRGQELIVYTPDSWHAIGILTWTEFYPFYTFKSPVVKRIPREEGDNAFARYQAGNKPGENTIYYRYGQHLYYDTCIHVTVE